MNHRDFFFFFFERQVVHVFIVFICFVQSSKLLLLVVVRTLSLTGLFLNPRPWVHVLLVAFPPSLCIFGLQKLTAGSKNLVPLLHTCTLPRTHTISLRPWFSVIFVLGARCCLVCGRDGQCWQRLPQLFQRKWLLHKRFVSLPFIVLHVLFTATLQTIKSIQFVLFRL